MITTTQVIRRLNNMYPGMEIRELDDFPENNYTRPITNIVAYEMWCEDYEMRTGKKCDIKYMPEISYYKD